MTIPDISNGPVFDAGYTPYFYQSGKFLAYDISHRDAKSQEFGKNSSYSITNHIVPKSSWPKVTTVEDIIQKGYFAIPGSEPETAIISDKKHTSGLGLSDIISQIRGRYEIYERNMYQIELGKCYAVSGQLAVEAERGGVRTSSRESYSLTKRLNEFYEQQRDERTRLWQDVSRLKQALPEQAQQYLTSYRKISILEDNSTGDSS